jgi:hypothetical protein
LTTTLRCSAKHLHRAPLHWQQWSACAPRFLLVGLFITTTPREQ